MPLFYRSTLYSRTTCSYSCSVETRTSSLRHLLQDATPATGTHELPYSNLLDPQNKVLARLLHSLRIRLSLVLDRLKLHDLAWFVAFLDAAWCFLSDASHLVNDDVSAL